MSDPILPEETIFSLTLIPLMKGLVQKHQDEKLWNQVVRLQSKIRDHVKPLGLQLQLAEAEGFAWLSQREFTDEETQLPRLVPRHRLSYNLSLLLALLRRRLAELDSQGGDLRLVLTLEEMQTMMALFLPDTGNEARRRDQVAAQVAKAEDMGFIRRVNSGTQVWEVQRILGLFVDAQWLGDLAQRIEAYRDAALRDQMEGDEA